MDPIDAQVRMVSFFDTPGLVLNKAGVVVHARRGQGREDDSVIKLRPVVPGELPQALRKSLELSTKCPPGEMFQAAAEARAFLAGRGVDLSGSSRPRRRRRSRTSSATWMPDSVAWAPGHVGFRSLVRDG